MLTSGTEACLAQDVEQRLRDQKQAAAAKAKQRSEQLTAAWDG